MDCMIHDFTIELRETAKCVYLATEADVAHDLSEKLKKSALIIETQENMLLNAFQIAKNGKHLGHLKFEEFKKLVSKKHDHNGVLCT